jgi:16S rRNA (cytosine1402-N4)-methyltransferase
MTDIQHLPVLVEQVVEMLEPNPGDIVVDATLGLGGHALAILPRIGKRGKYLGIDQDEYALRSARTNLRQFENAILVHGNFDCLRSLAETAGVGAADGILFDLGVSSLQIDDTDRGFSYLHNAPLDMRMDPSGDAPTAAELLRTADEAELTRILREYGEERASKIVAKRIVETRKANPILTTDDLAKLVPGGGGKHHPARKVFQALPKAVELLAPKGRLAVITFHSLEDRMVKRTFRQWSDSGQVNIINKKVIKPTRAEVLANRRARSAKLRVIEKVKS